MKVQMCNPSSLSWGPTFSLTSVVTIQPGLAQLKMTLLDFNLDLTLEWVSSPLWLSIKSKLQMALSPRPCHNFIVLIKTRVEKITPQCLSHRRSSTCCMMSVLVPQQNWCQKASTKFLSNPRLISSSPTLKSLSSEHKIVDCLMSSNY